MKTDPGGINREKAAELTQRARAIAPELRDLALEAEKQRRLPKRSMELMREAGLIEALQPAACGGEQLGMRAHVDIVSAIGEACGSSAWVLATAQAHSWLMGHFNAQAREEVYGEETRTHIAAVINPRGQAVRRADGSYLLSGFWPFASGSEHAKWLMMGGLVMNEDGEQVDEGLFLLTPDQMTFNDDWHVSGLQGTGSCSVTCKDAEIAPHRFLSTPPLIAGTAPSCSSEAIAWSWRSQAMPVLILCLCSAPLGMAKGAFKEWLKVVPGKPVPHADQRSDLWAPNHVALGEAGSTLRAAELLLYDTADLIDRLALEGVAMPKDQRARSRADCALAVSMLSQAVDRIYVNGGGAGLSIKSPIQRASRDLRAASMHGSLMLDTCLELYGRVLMGQEPHTPNY